MANHSNQSWLRLWPKTKQWQNDNAAQNAFAWSPNLQKLTCHPGTGLRAVERCWLLWQSLAASSASCGLPIQKTKRRNGKSYWYCSLLTPYLLDWKATPTHFVEKACVTNIAFCSFMKWNWSWREGMYTKWGGSTPPTLTKKWKTILFCARRHPSRSLSAPFLDLALQAKMAKST